MKRRLGVLDCESKLYKFDPMGMKMSSNGSDKEDTTIYKVVMNHEEQYSIWPDYKEIRGAGNMLVSRALRQNVWPISSKLEPT